MTYDPAVFDVSSLADARTVILTPEDSTTDERWARETAWFAELAVDRLALGAHSIVLDYGCGVGRIAKALIERTGCSVFGVDISPSMRALAVDYVASDRFACGAPEALHDRGAAFTAGVAAWVLQHCQSPEIDITLIKGSLKARAPLLVLNNDRRAIPVRGGRWADDRRDVRRLLERRFEETSIGRPPLSVTSPDIAFRTFWALYR